jgi:putative restriction endonuclease
METFFFEENDWIPQPDTWPSNAAAGKTLSIEEGEGKHLFQEIFEKLQRTSICDQIAISDTREVYQHYSGKRRLGQGAFRVLVRKRTFDVVQ